jgi:hypothetical protein
MHDGQVWRHWSRGSVQPLLEGCPDEGLRAQEMLRCIHVGLLCVQEDPHIRPTMASVVVMLNSRSITLPAPAAPAYAVPGQGITVRGVASQGLIDVAASGDNSINDASISDLEPR